MYEAQVVDRDSRMKGIQGPGAIFGRIAPAKNAGRPGGDWQRDELTLVDRHVTVVLNGETVIDNQPLPGCTSGALSADETRPGPIYLQGDHTRVSYRPIIVLRPAAFRRIETDRLPRPGAAAREAWWRGLATPRAEWVACMWPVWIVAALNAVISTSEDRRAPR